MNNPQNKDSMLVPGMTSVDPLYTWLSTVSEGSFNEIDLDKNLQQGTGTPNEETLFDIDASWKKILKKAGKSQQQRFRSHRFRTLLVAAIVIALSMGLLTAQAMGVDVFGAIARWTEQVFWFDQQSTMVDASVMDQRIELGWVPDGYSCVETSETDDFAFKAYTGKEEDEWFTVSVYDCAENSTIFEKDTSVVVFEEYGDTIYYGFRNLECPVIAWQSGSREYSLTGQLSVETLLNIAKNIDEKDGK